MINFVDEYARIADHTLNKYFVLKNRNYRQIDIDNLDVLLNAEQMELERCKERVSKKCKEFGSAAWSKHTMTLHPAKGLNTELMDEFSTLRSTVSQAYIKFGELLETYPDLTKPHESFNKYSLRTLHLCEAPGCFVQALADFLPEKLRSRWLWRANSLMPYNENAELEKMLIDDRFVSAYIDNFLPGPDSTGNLMNFTEDYVAAFLGETGKFQLVTCDGSFDCTDNPGNQEATVYPLILQSWKVAMKCLQNNGCAIIKIYTLFSQDMLNFMNQFCPMFESVFLHKPAASKPGNSEVYLVGIKFRETDIVEPAGNDLRFSVYEAARYFARTEKFQELGHQIEAINFNLNSFGKLTQYQRSAIDIKKKEIKARIKSRLRFIATSVLGKRFLNKLEENNHWQKEAWGSMKSKVHFYPEYRQMFYKPTSLPIVFTPEWSLDLMSSFVITNETLSSIVRSNYVVLALRASRMALLDPYRVSCSMFADYKLMEFAQDVGLSFYDMCCVRKTPSFRRLRYNFLLQGSDLFVDSLFTSRSDWLELCYYAAHQRISPENILPNSNLAILLPKPTTAGFIVNNIRICLNYGSSLILSRFSASVIFFLTLFFDEVVFDKNEIRFSKRKRVSEEYSLYIRQLALNVPSTQDVVQFVPLCFFTNYCVYSKVLAFNNQGLHDLLQKEEERQRQFMEASVN